VVAAELLLIFIDQLCATGPVLLVADDMPVVRPPQPCRVGEAASRHESVAVAADCVGSAGADMPRDAPAAIE